MVTDLGPGDGGKGGVVHKLSHMLRAHTVVKVGGAQGSHGVRTASGQSFAFSQFGCGTLEGVRTHLSRRFVIDPIGIGNEAGALRYEMGIHDPFSLLTINRNALCNTPFHGIMSRITELARGKNPRGTVGTGVGVTQRLHEMHPELSLVAGDLRSAHLREKLIELRTYLIQVLKPLCAQEFLPEDQDLLTRDLILLEDPGFLDYTVAQFQAVARECVIVDDDYFAQNILSRDGVIVVESSHGILTDRLTGFHPHTSALRTLPHFTREMFAQGGYDGQIVSIGVHRAYQIRHGAGPMPTHDQAMSAHLLPGSHKNTNRWQGEVRVGPLDLTQLRYALAASGAHAYDALAITWFDQVQREGQWRLSNRYHDPLDPRFFTPEGDIRLPTGSTQSRLTYLEGLTNLMQKITPEVVSLPIPVHLGRDALYAYCAATLQEYVSVPVRMVSFGPTERDKVYT
jgi:adenylosuccinate synthase